MSEHASEERDLRAALQLAVAKICLEAEHQEMDDDDDNNESNECNMTTSAVKALSELTYQYATTCLSNDLQSFSRHANRRTITVEDVLLVARKDPQGLQSKLSSFCEREKLSNKKEKTVSKTNGGSSSKKKKKKKETTSTSQRMKELEAVLQQGIDDDSSSDNINSDSDVEMVEKPKQGKSSAHALNVDDDSSDDDIMGNGENRTKTKVTGKPKSIGQQEDDPFATSSDEDDTNKTKPVVKKKVPFLPNGTKSGFSSDESDEDMF